MRGPTVVSRSVLFRYFGAVLVTAAAVGLRLALNPLLGDDVPYIVDFFAIAFAAWLFGFGPAIVTTATLQLAIGWIYLGPLTSFSAFDRGDQVSLVISTLSSIGIALIVNSLRQTQKDLQREKEAAERANEAKDRFLSMITHELRNPINSIALSASGLRLRSQAPERILSAVERIERATRTLAEMVETLVDSTRVSTGQFRVKPVVIDLVPVVHAAIEVMRPAAEAKGIALIAKMGAEPTMILGDADRLRESICNIIQNAIKFTPKGGHVTVALDLIERGARIAISDDGEGIDLDFLPQIFERFTQAQPSTGGSRGGLGLGLSIVKHVVELHEGTIAAHSEGKGRGATFTIVLPLVEPVRNVASGQV